VTVARTIWLGLPASFVAAAGRATNIIWRQSQRRDAPKDEFFYVLVALGNHFEHNAPLFHIHAIELSGLLAFAGMCRCGILIASLLVQAVR
jgi:hypothetical protein